MATVPVVTRAWTGRVREAAAAAARLVGPAALVGAVCGVVVVGVLGRLAMLLLALLNPSATGVTSDDGFVIGQFTLSGSLQLALAGLQFGVLGALVYLALRPLLVGPDWFRLVSVTAGPAVVAAALIVHPDGVDFRVLEPLWLAVALFVALPATFAALLRVVHERVLARRHPVPPAVVGVGLLCLLTVPPLLPVLAGVLLVFLGSRAWRGTGPGTPPAAVVWTLRVLIALVLLLAVGDLVSDVRELS